MMKIKRRVTKSYFEIACHQYTPLIQKLAFKIGFNNNQIEELSSRGFEELLKCMICYNRSGSFITFLHGRLDGVFRHMRDAENRSKRIPTMPTDLMEDMSGHNNEINNNMIVQECLECLSKEEYDIIIDLFFDEKTMREVSSERGGVASTICRIKSKAIDKMRKKCEVGSGNK